jgi:hypothetical protein
MKKKYQSKIDYSKKYNSKLSTFQIDKELHGKVKEYCKLNNLGIREFLENLIKNNISL